MTTLRRLLLALCVWSVCLSALAEPAESKATKEEARAHFKQGVTLVREGAYRAALVELKRAYELSPDYRVLFNIAQTELQLGEYAAAIDAFETYLSQGGDKVEPERRADVEANLAELKKRVAMLRVEADAAGVEVSIDGVRAGITPLKHPLKVSIGRHEVTGATEDGRTAREVVEVAGGDQRVVRLKLDAAHDDEPVASEREPVKVTEPKDEGMSTRRRTGIVLTSVGGAVLIGAVVTGILAKGARDDHRAALAKPEGNLSEIDGTRSDLKTYALTTDLLGGVAAALVVTGIVLTVLPEKARASSDVGRGVDVGVGYGNLTVRGRF